MNIALLIEQQFDPNAGGVERSTSKLAQIFKSHSHNVIIISLNNKQPDDIVDGIEIFSACKDEKVNTNLLVSLLKKHETGIVLNQAGYSVHITKLLLEVRQHKFFKIINTLRINPLNFITNHKMFISQFLKSKRLTFLNSPLLRAIILKKHKLKQASELNYIIKHVDAFVMLSERFKPELYQISAQLEQYDDKIRGISNPFPIPDIKQKDLTKENAILFVGRLDITQKRVDLLLQIWKQLHAKLPEWEFWIVGHGDEEAAMKDFCKENELNRVTFFGKCDPNPFYKKAKIFHMTSAFEGFGNVLVEAQSFGCIPIMFNSYSAAKDIVVDNKTGYLIEPFKIEDYVKQTAQLTQDDEKIQSLGLSAREHSKIFSYDTTYEKWEKIFNLI